MGNLSSSLIVNRPRIAFAIYFLLLGWTIARGLPPLPEEPPRINFWGLALVTGCVISAIQMLTSRQRAVPLLILFGLPIAAWHLQKQVKLMQMIIQPHGIEDTALYTLPLIFLALLAPAMMREFDDTNPKAPPLRRSGLPF